MSVITTHVLDMARGLPASGIPVTLEVSTAPGQWTALGQGTTDADGRLRDLLPAESTLTAGAYRLTFDTQAYFAAQKVDAFYPRVVVEFVIRDTAQHYHVPLLLSPFGFSTYRGS